MSDNNGAGKPRQIYGFKANFRERKSEVELRIDKVDKFNIPYTIIPKRLILSALMAAVLIIGTTFFLLIDLRRAVYIGIPMILMVIALLILIGLYAFLFPAFGSLLEISINLINHLITSRQVKKGKKARSKKTGFKRTRKDGLIRYSSGNIGRLALLDGRTSKTAFPTEILIQEGIAARYHTARNRSVTETIITSSQKQSTELQLENMRALIETNEDDAIKELINLQYEYTDKKIEGQATTFVQYLLMIAPDEQSLEEAIENLSNSVEEGLYYNVQFLNKKDTDKVLSDIKGFK
ncbi:hypothetical protein NAC36_002421 [Staphylococcus pseudintermedius]|uniref:hypothetical protein n=2 Tax=Staphylococcus pseudintermedius TaxID=283734 RepID=UPI000BBCC651|nr:hypothetical protein [Staphylococcus pseudintermedius]EGQ2789523.1 hypothetical protein [Staphylococcus pseudintermedius]EGQ2899961.1 hypothetical protein [Staphylococcus pseudintermedius]EGQ3068754.1 hypothetical protein [Staphylococcus pseudintermedius]EGQ3075934.1 hypothetical protein [Staphylococcus pseudintermedius]EGQ3318385.1 hypothetical protein [Staphylococcus pseudintermedius]